jgi:hypothetical protein
VIEVVEIFVGTDMLARDTFELAKVLVCDGVAAKFVFEVVEVCVCEVNVFDCVVDVVDLSSSLSSSPSPSSRAKRSAYQARSLLNDIFSPQDKSKYYRVQIFTGDEAKQRE